MQRCMQSLLLFAVFSATVLIQSCSSVLDVHDGGICEDDLDEMSLIQASLQFKARVIGHHSGSPTIMINDTVTSKAHLETSPQLQDASTNHKNLALHRPTSQSSTDHEGNASRAVDGDINPFFKYSSCTHTTDAHWAGSWRPWWQVDLGEVKAVSLVRVLNRDGCCSNRLDKWQVWVSSEDKFWKEGAASPHLGSTATPCGPEQGAVGSGEWAEVDCQGLQGSHVGVVVNQNNGILTLCEVEVFGTDPTTTTTTPTIMTNTPTSTTTTTTASTTAATDERPFCKLSKAGWDAGYGNCATYREGAPPADVQEQSRYNHDWCSKDTDGEGVYADQVCEECGKCQKLPACVNKPGWDVGHGTCNTYGVTKNDYLSHVNHLRCDEDKDPEGTYAQQVCQECGKCVNDNVPLVTTTTTTSEPPIVYKLLACHKWCDMLAGAQMEPGGDGDNLDTCREACDENPLCMFFCFDSDTKRCVLYNTCDKISDKPDGETEDTHAWSTYGKVNDLLLERLEVGWYGLLQTRTSTVDDQQIEQCS